MLKGYRTKTFLAIFSVAATALVLASALNATALRRQAYERIERGLVNEAKLAAELLSHRAAATGSELQDEAQALGRGSDARVTLIGADGRVVGDSSQTEAGLAHLENHGARPEVVDARQHGIGISSRFSATLGIDMLYVAAAVRHPSIATIRLSLPLTDIDRQLRTIWRSAIVAIAASVVGAFVMAWVGSSLLVRRLNRLAADARRYAAGDTVPAVADHEDDEIGTVAKVLDEAVRKQAERAADLARDRGRMEAILAGMIEGVVVIDAGGRVRLLNRAASGILRIDGDVAGRHFLECVRHPAVVSQLDAALSHRAEPSDGPRVIREGSRVFVARSAAIAGATGGGAVLVLHDITDLHRADQIRRDFVANVSHELRTPLTAIRGYVEALQDGPTDPDDRRRFLDIIARHSARLERLATDLLRLARLDAREEPLDYSTFRLADVFADVVADLRPAIEQRRQRVDVDVDASADLVTVDVHHLRDAVRNVVENASIYSPPDSLITVAARVAHREVVITVADEGPGIPAADLSRVFERFYRVDKSRARESGGTGLGLAIVKHVVERMGGSVCAENGPTRGAVITMTLPARQPVGGAAAAAS